MDGPLDADPRDGSIEFLIQRRVELRRLPSDSPSCKRKSRPLNTDRFRSTQTTTAVEQLPIRPDSDRRTDRPTGRPVGVTPTVEIPTAIDTATNELTTSLPVVAPTAIALEVTAHHSVDQHWRPAHDRAVLSANVCTADRLIVSTVRCRSVSSRQPTDDHRQRLATPGSTARRSG